MKIIHKYKILASGRSVFLDLPKNFEIISAKIKGKDIFVWAVIDEKEPIIKQEFMVIGTGWPFEDRMKFKFIDTVILEYGLVFHIFVRIVP